MRVILMLVLLLGIATMVLAELEHAEEVARWSNVYALFAQTGDRNPLQSKDISDRFDAIVSRKNSFSAALSGSGLLTCILAIVGLLKVTQVPRQAKHLPDKAD